jgi:hypothetical protein
MKDPTRKAFEDAGQGKNRGVLAEFFLMLRHNKKYWLAPIIILLLALGLLVILGGSAVAPFIYTLF